MFFSVIAIYDFVAVVLLLCNKCEMVFKFNESNCCIWE